jgi:hypothetical protein
MFFHFFKCSKRQLKFDFSNLPFYYEQDPISVLGLRRRMQDLAGSDSFVMSIRLFNDFIFFLLN